ncbi:MAG: valine--tRNA ligase [Phycisphaerae bacterium]|nr:valine--tRNA ligase [Phycisphaerae bacterium]
MAKTDSKSYDPAAVEKPLFEYWEGAGHFKAQPRGSAPPFCMVIPPPNVTGALHLGHALNNTLQDILIRHRRMQGFNTFWLVGTDHAGIATQATVEKTIRKTEGKSRHDLGRDELVRRIWDWKAKYGSRIVEQLKLMGCSCDYSRERFTLDEGCAKAVRETFFKLFCDGLIYRGKRLVNWDTELQTAVADDEVYHETVKGHFYHLKYPIENPPPGGPAFVHVATTRPETMLGDTAVAVHPRPDVALDRAEAALREKLKSAPEKEKADLAAQIDAIIERRTAILPALLKLRDLAKAGAKIRLPLTNRIIPLILDEWAKPELGSGCVKITPAHDANDYEVYKRHPGIGIINVLTADGKIAEVVELDGSANPASPAYAGLKFATAGREKVVADLTAGGFMEKIEDRQIEIGHSDRSKSMIEPFLSDQWFVKMGDLTAGEAARISPGPFRDYLDGHSDAQELPDSAGQGPSAASGSPSAASGSPSAASGSPSAASGSPSAARRSPLPEQITHFSSQKVDDLSQNMSDSAQNSNDSSQTLQDLELKSLLLSQKQDDLGQNSTDSGQMSADSVQGGPVAPRRGTAAPRRGTAAARRGPAEERQEDAAAQKMPGLAQFAIDAVADGRVKFHPDRYAKTYIDWLSEKRDWCISRQLWWGHRIPVWTGRTPAQIGAWGVKPDKLKKLSVEYFIPDDIVPEVKNTTIPETSGDNAARTWFVCLRGEPNADDLKILEEAGFTERDPDVLDTWFSSALWAHSTLGWPEPQRYDNLLATFYPTSVLSTAREIITLWVARMVMFGLYNLGKVPFKDVVIHPVIQDGQGRKMSKTLGNGVDPVDIIDKYGADALRFTLAELATETQDIRMPVTKERQADGREINVSTKFEKGRNFCNKLWQAATGYVLPNAEGHTPRPLHRDQLKLEDRWILSRMTSCLIRVDEALATYRFSDAVGELYRFMWDDYCSAYIEMTKSRLSADQGDVARQVLLFVLDRLLRMLHPVTPYVTEAIWQEINRVAPRRGLYVIEQPDQPLISSHWPAVDKSWQDAGVENEMAHIQDIIRTGREIRTRVNEYRSQAKQPTIRSLPRMVVTSDAATCASFKAHAEFIRSLAGCDELVVSESAAKPPGSLSRVVGAMIVHVPAADLIDLSLVRATEEKKLAELRAALERAEKQLANPNFVQRADPGIVEQARSRAAELRMQIEAGERHLSELE